MRRAGLGLALVLAGCTYNLHVRALATQELTVPAGHLTTLRADHGGIVHLIDQTTHRPLYNGLVAVGDDVTLDPATQTVAVRGLVAANGVRPGDVVQITFD